MLGPLERLTLGRLERDSHVGRRPRTRHTQSTGVRTQGPSRFGRLRSSANSTLFLQFLSSLKSGWTGVGTHTGPGREGSVSLVALCREGKVKRTGRSRKVKTRPHIYIRTSLLHGWAGRLRRSQLGQGPYRSFGPSFTLSVSYTVRQTAIHSVSRLQYGEWAVDMGRKSNF